MVTILICLGYLKLYKHHLIIPIFHKTRSLQYQKTKRKYSQIQGLPQRLPCVHFSHFIAACEKSAGPAQSQNDCISLSHWEVPKRCILTEGAPRPTKQSNLWVSLSLDCEDYIRHLSNFRVSAEL